MPGVFNRFRAVLFAVILSLACAAQNLRADAPSAAWTPTANDPFSFALDLAESCLNRGVPSIADAELANAAPLASDAPKDARLRYGTLALRAAIESANLESQPGRDGAARQIDQLRETVEGRDFRKDNFEFFAAPETLSAAEKRYALALARALYTLGALEFELQDAGATSSKALNSALELTKYLARALPAQDARPFLYWHAKATLANLADPDRVARAEKFAAALEKNARDNRDEFWFFASTLLVETARERGDLELAAQRVAAILDALKSRDGDPDAPREIAAALVALELKLLQAEGKETDALRQATQDVDLLDAPFPENSKRFDELFDNPFDELNLARAELYWRAAAKAPTKRDLERLDASDDATPRIDRETLVAEARRVGRLVRANALRARCQRFAKAAGESSGDWQTLEIAAQEAFRADRFRDALDAYGRAAQAARDADDLDAARRLDVAAAALLDKAIREKRFDELGEESSLRADAAKRFETLARQNPGDEGADLFMLLALEYRESLGEDDPYFRFEYLKLFPDAKNRAAFALDLARRSLETGAFDDAWRALDYVPSDDPALPDALELERAILDAQRDSDSDSDPDALLAFALDRIYNRLSVSAPASENESSASLEALAKRLDAASFDALATSDHVILAAFFDLAVNSDAVRDRNFAPALANALAKWRAATDPSDSDALAKVDAVRLAFAIATDAQDAVVDLLKKKGAAGSDLDLTTLERALALAQNAKPDARQKLAQFALDALDSVQDASPRAQILRADALRLLDRAQESLNLFAKLRKTNPKNAAVARGIARILTAQKGEKALRLALDAWSDLAELLPVGSKEWWDAKEETVKIYCRIGDPDQAEKIVKTLWLARDDPSDPGRRRRCEKTIATARAAKTTPR